MWNISQTQQVRPLTEGENRLRVEQDGPLFFRLTLPRGRDNATDEVRIRLDGGTPLPI